MGFEPAFQMQLVMHSITILVVGALLGIAVAGIFTRSDTMVSRLRKDHKVFSGTPRGDREILRAAVQSSRIIAIAFALIVGVLSYVILTVSVQNLSSGYDPSLDSNFPQILCWVWKTMLYWLWILPLPSLWMIWPVSRQETVSEKETPGQVG